MDLSGCLASSQAGAVGDDRVAMMTLFFSCNVQVFNTYMWVQGDVPKRHHFTHFTSYHRQWLRALCQPGRGRRSIAKVATSKRTSSDFWDEGCDRFGQTLRPANRGCLASLVLLLLFFLLVVVVVVVVGIWHHQVNMKKHWHVKGRHTLGAYTLVLYVHWCIHSTLCWDFSVITWLNFHIPGFVQQRHPSAELVSRLDKETSGCLLIPLTAESAKEFTKQFAETKAEKCGKGVFLATLKPCTQAISCASAFYLPSVFGAVWTLMQCLAEAEKKVRFTIFSHLQSTCFTLMTNVPWHLAQVRKCYVAVVQGHPPEKGHIEEALSLVQLGGGTKYRAFVDETGKVRWQLEAFWLLWF